eukprot:UN14282
MLTREQCLQPDFLKCSTWRRTKCGDPIIQRGGP